MSPTEQRKIFLVSYLYDPNVRSGMGGFQKVFNLARAWSGRHQVTLFLPRYSRNETELDCVWIPLIDLPVLRVVSFNLMLGVLMVVRSLRGRPSVLYCRIFNSLTPPLISALLGASLVVEFNGDPLQYYRKRNSLKTWFVHRVLKWNLSRSRKVVALTEGLKRILESGFGIDPVRIHVSPSGSDPGVFFPRERKRCRDALQLPKTGAIAVFVGTFFDYQGIDVLLKAMTDTRLRDLNVWLVGEGEKRREWEYMAGRLGLDQVHFSGQVEREKAALYLGAADFCLAPFSPDRGEVSPLKVLDYLFCARSAVVSRIPSVETLLEEFSSLVPFVPGDPGSLAKRLVEMMEDPDRLDRAASRDSETARNRYSWHAIARHIEEACF